MKIVGWTVQYLLVRAGRDDEPFWTAQGCQTVPGVGQVLELSLGPHDYGTGPRHRRYFQVQEVKSAVVPSGTGECEGLSVSVVRLTELADAPRPTTLTRGMTADIPPGAGFFRG